jgi:hypothetical protein
MLTTFYLLAVWTFRNTVLELTQWALHTAATWCGEVDLSVNPEVNEPVLTRKRNLPGSFEPLFFGVTLHRSQPVKYLGVALDSRLTRRQHECTKVHNLMLVCRRANRVTWGQRPEVLCWLYVSIIRSSITLAPLVCLPGCQTASAKKTLRRIQRLACLEITAIMRTTPMGAVEALACLPPLNLWFRISCTSTLESKLLGLPSPQSRAQQYIDAVSEVGSNV